MLFKLQYARSYSVLDGYQTFDRRPGKNKSIFKCIRTRRVINYTVRNGYRDSIVENK